MKRFRKPGDIKVGVIGYGGAFEMGREHLREMMLAGMTPVAVTEIDAKRRKVAGDHFPGIKTFASTATMLKKSDVNLIAIITPHNTHAKLALQCLRAGRHVVCEKPFAITTAECDAMIAEARKRKLVVSTYHNRHWDGWILEAVKRIVKQKAIGEVYRIEAHMGGYGKPGDWWRSSKSISGGVMYDWGVHLLEYALQLIGSELVEVSGHAKTGFWAPQTKWGKDTNEDEGFAIARFRNGAWLTLNCSSLDNHPKQGMLEITGTGGAYIMEWGKFTLIRPGRKGPVVEEGKNPRGKSEAFYQNVADHMVKGTKLVITPEWARRPIHILDLANRSAKLKKALKAKYK
jgi:scyllo-inositol 2-dehydrogenase (NADP+)